MYSTCRALSRCWPTSKSKISAFTRSSRAHPRRLPRR
jgi:hypothetical protein